MEADKEGPGRTVMPEIELPMVDGIDWNYGLMHLNEPELLINTVGDFYKILELEADKLDDFYSRIHEEQEMVTQYRIKVHSMKSSANLIGATVLGGMAKILEDAARREELDYIDKLHPIFNKEWRSYKEKLADCIQIIQKDEIPLERKEPMDKEEILSYLELLKEAMLEMDIDGMDANIEKLQAYQYAEEVQSNMEKLSVLVTNMDIDETVSLIEQIAEQIK